MSPNNASSSSPSEALFAPGADRPPRRSRRLRRLLLTALLLPPLLLLGLLAAMPHLLSSDAALVAVLSRLNRAWPEGRIEVRGGWQWRWFGPCQIREVSLSRRDGSFAASFESLSCSRGLAAWLGRCQDFGTITLAKPALSLTEIDRPFTDQVQGRGDSRPSRLGEAAGESQAQGRGATSPSRTGAAEGGWPQRLNPHGRLLVSDGSLVVWPLEAPSVRVAAIALDLTLAGRGPLALRFSSSPPRAHGFPSDPAALIELQAALDSLATACSTPQNAGLTVSLSIPAFPLALAEALLPPDAARPKSAAGQLALALDFAASGAQRQLSGQLRLADLQLAGGALAAGDRIAWPEASLDFDLQQSPALLSLSRFALATPYGALEATGQLPLAAVATSPGPAPASPPAPADNTLTAQGRFDLAALAAQLPATLRLRPGVTIEQALLRFDGEAVARPAGLALFAMLRCDGIAARDGERPLTVELPLALGLNARLDQARTLENFALTLKSPPLTLSARGDAAAGELTGEAALDQLAAALAPLLQPEALTTFPAGLLRLAGGWQAQAGLLSLNGSLAATGLSLPQASGAALELGPGQAQFAASLAVDRQRDEIRLQQLELSAGAFALQGSGMLTARGSEKRLDLAALLGIDFDQLQPVIAACGPEGLLVAGRSSQPLRLSLPLGGGRAYLLSALELESALAPARLTLPGLEAEAPTLSLHVRDGILQLAAGAQLNEGRFALAAVVDLMARPPFLTLPAAATVLEDARLTQEILEHQLARIHPILRGCAVTAGRVSLGLGHLALPLDASATAQMDWTADLTLRETRLMAAGPLAEVVTALKLKNREVLITNQTLTVACRAGRFYPAPLDLTLSGQPLRVAGSVGLDGSLDYAVELPLTAALVGDEAWRYLRGQTLRLPLSGTAARPRLDSTALQEELRRLLAEVGARVAAEKARDELRHQMKDRLKELDTEKVEEALRKLRRRAQS